MTTLPIDWLHVARQVLLSRKMDQLEVEQLTPQGKVKYQFSSAGHDLAQVLLAQALTHPHDAATVYYRSRPFALACGLTAAELLTASFAKDGGPTRGRDTGVMYNLPRRSGPTILPASGDVGAQYTPAAGWAQAITYHAGVLKDAAWQGAIAAAMGGEGSTAANGFWAALNIVTTRCLPYLFFIEDNSFGLSVPSHFQTPCGNIADNLQCFNNLITLDGDGTEPAAAWEMISKAVSLLRGGSNPVLLRMEVVRLEGHTYVDNQAYKTNEQRALEAERDPLPRLKKYLLDQQITDNDGWAKLESEIDQELQQALLTAETASQPDPETTADHVFFQGVPPVVGGLRPAEVLLPIGSSVPQSSGPRINFIDAVRRTLESEMERNPRVLIFGEDVGVKGGVHGATLNMYTRFGEQRVFDTSLNEDGIIGRSVGMALAGLMPVPEIQFRKYADPAHEQISDLGTLRWRTVNHFAAPVVVRIPVGFSKKTGDPWHSVSGEAIYAHLGGWRIAYPSNAEDAVGLLRTAMRGDDPTFFFEHRALLDTPEGRRPYPGDDFCLPFGKAAVLLTGNELTVVTWGAMLPRCLEAAQAFPGKIDLLDLRTIIPWDRPAVLESVTRTGKLLIVHEDNRTGGFAAEIMAVVTEQAFSFLDAPITRLATPDVPIPYNIPMMDSILPGSKQISDKIGELIAY